MLMDLALWMAFRSVLRSLVHTWSICCTFMSQIVTLMSSYIQLTFAVVNGRTLIIPLCLIYGWFSFSVPGFLIRRCFFPFLFPFSLFLLFFILPIFMIILNLIFFVHSTRNGGILVWYITRNWILHDYQWMVLKLSLKLLIWLNTNGAYISG